VTLRETVPRYAIEMLVIARAAMQKMVTAL
jgi:hypothetical protein